MFSQATFNASAGYRSVISFTLGLITQTICSLQNGVAARLKIFCRFARSGSHVYDCTITTISSDAESHKEQDGGKYLFVGQTTTELQAILQVHVNKNTEKKPKPKILASVKKAAFPTSFADQDHQNKNFMMSNTVINSLLLG